MTVLESQNQPPVVKAFGERRGGEKVSLADRYMDFLTAEGYRPSVDDDGDVLFKHEGGHYYISVAEEDELFFQLVYPRFWSIEDEDERQRVLSSANEINLRFKVVKIYTRDGDTTATLECFMSSLDDFKAYFERCMRAVQRAVSEFREMMIQSQKADGVGADPESKN